MHALLGQADRAAELLQFHPDTYEYRHTLLVKAKIHSQLGQLTIAKAIYRQLDEAFTAAERRRSLKADDHHDWIQIITNMGGLTLGTNQLESAKRYYLRVLAWPGLKALNRVIALEGMAAYHRERKEWIQVTECCEEALTLVLDAKKKLVNEDEMFMKEVSILFLLADAAEGQGDIRRACEYDEATRKLWDKNGNPFVGSDRRKAVELLNAGRPREAASILAYRSAEYTDILDHSGINLLQLRVLTLVMAALKVLVEALVKVGNGDTMSEAVRIQADVEETEAILAGYWEKVLEETRWELREQQRGGGPGAAGAGEEGAETKKKSKAAKRKQQKRKAQQQKRTGEVAEAAAAAAVEGGLGGEVAGGQQEQAQQAQQQEKEHEEEENEGHVKDDKGSKQGAMGVAAGIAAMGLNETQEQQEEEEEEEEEDECSVYLNAIESNDAANPAGPPLVCGHRYHAFCLHFRVERCTMKCIEPTCPYCRSPLQEMESTLREVFGGECN